MWRRGHEAVICGHFKNGDESVRRAIHEMGYSLLHSTPFSISNPNLRRRSLLRIEIHQHTIG